MLASEIKIEDFRRIGPILERLILSEKLTADEKRAVDFCARAAFDFAQMRHSAIAKEFYSRGDVQERTVHSIAA